MNSAISNRMADLFADLGDIHPSRVQVTPAPGMATLDDLVNINGQHSRLFELVDNTIVEKAMGYEASVVAGAILEILRRFVSPQKLGLISGADGMFQLCTSSVRGPDVAFISRQRLASNLPLGAYPTIAPDLVVEVLSPGNTRAEMARKRIEYFHSGVQLVWIVDCANRSVAVFTSPADVTELGEQDWIDGGDVLVGFKTMVSDFFTDLDLLQSSPN